MTRKIAIFITSLLLVGGLAVMSGCEVEVDEGPIEDAAEEIVEG